MQRVTKIMATFALPTKDAARTTIDVVVDKITIAVVHGRMGSMPVTFRRADGRQLITNRKGDVAYGGWRIDPKLLIEPPIAIVEMVP